jgi:hypothetical protein
MAKKIPSAWIIHVGDYFQLFLLIQPALNKRPAQPD